MEKRDRLVMDQFNRLADDFYNFKKATYEAAVIPLKGVSMIELTIGEFSISATWENPQQDTVTPTHVRVRVQEISPDDWAEYTYPINSWSFAGLLPDTQYTLQIQLVARFESTDTFVSTTRNCPSVQVLRTAESPIKTKIFTTLDGVGPPTDAGIDDFTVDFTFPTPPGAGTVGSSGCWWEYQFQQFDEGTPALYDSTWVDLGSPVEVDGNIGDVQVDLSAAPFTAYQLFRMKYREVCNGVDGPWIYGDGFSGMNVNIPCGDLTQSDSASLAPYDSADWFDIVPCQNPGSPLGQKDSISGNLYVKQAPGYRGYSRTTDGEWTVYAENTADPAISNRVHVPLLTNNMTQIGALHSTSNFSFAVDVYMPTLDDSWLPTPRNLLVLGNKIFLIVVHRQIEYDVFVQIPRDGGGVYTLRANGLQPSTWNSILYSHDATDPNGRILYVNNVEVDRSSGSADLDLDEIDTTFQLNTFAFQATRKVYGWRRAIASDENAELILAGMLGWWDTSDYVSGNWVNRGTAGSALDFIRGASTANPAFTAGEWVLDGVDDYLYVPSSPILDIAANESATLGVFVHPGSTTSGGRYISRDDGGTTMYNIQNGTASVGGRWLDNTLNTSAVGPAPVSTSGYQLFTTVRECANDRVVTYIGAAAGTPTTMPTEGAIDTALELRIGVISTGGIAIPFNAKAAFFTKRALSAAEIAAIAAYYA